MVVNTGPSGAEDELALSDSSHFTAADYLELMAYQRSGSAMSVSAAQALFGAVLL
jgi:hypothetical protein